MLTGGQSYLSSSSFQLPASSVSPYDWIELDGSDLPIKKMREVIGLAFQKPMGAVKYLVIRRADSLSIDVQNTLLKLLEEPPAYLINIIMTDKPESLLMTVRSRLRPVNYFRDSLNLAGSGRLLEKDYLQSSPSPQDVIESFKDREEFVLYLESKYVLVKEEFINGQSDSWRKLFLLNDALTCLKTNCNWKIIAHWLVLRWRSN